MLERDSCLLFLLLWFFLRKIKNKLQIWWLLQYFCEKSSLGRHTHINWVENTTEILSTRKSRNRWFFSSSILYVNRVASEVIEKKNFLCHAHDANNPRHLTCMYPNNYAKSEWACEMWILQPFALFNSIQFIWRIGEGS